MYYRTRAIIIKNRDFREADKLVTFFSEQRGKTTAVARGIKKPGSSLRACVQPFCHAQLYISQSKELGTITQGKMLDFYGNCREDLERTLYIMYIMELLDKTLMEQVPLVPLYRTVLEILELFNQTGLNLLALRYFETALLVNLGYKPVLNQCVVCGEKTRLPAFSIPEGGMVCAACRSQVADVVVLPGEVLGLLKLFSSGNLKIVSRVKANPAAMKKLELFLEHYLEYHLERKFYVKDTIKTLKNSIHLPD